MSKLPLNEHLIAAEKPAGIPTHKVDDGYPGFVEHLELKENKKLYPCHRLDKATSGVLLVSDNAHTAAQIGQLFAEHKVIKTYSFLSAVGHDSEQWTCTDAIDNKSAETAFTLIGPHGDDYLYQARPKTGRTHQIRRHAQASGTPIIGDTAYGGKPHHRLFLHASTLEIPTLNWQHKSPLPPSFSQIKNGTLNLLDSTLIAIEKRQALYPEMLNSPEQCLRLIHDEAPPLRVDKLGPVIHGGWWNDTAPTQKEIQGFTRLCEYVGCTYWTLRHYTKKAQDRKTIANSDPAPPDSWIAKEHQLDFEMRHSQGLSPGLFLDQREQRQWVFQHARDTQVLNLFSYTSGFSVAAACGGAKGVTSVDVSKAYLQWSRNNFQHNQVPLENHRFHAMDAFEFLNYAKKKGFNYDLILCDPPTFGRSPKGTFRIEKQWQSLLEKCTELLTPEGVLLFSTNFEAWGREKWRHKIRESLDNKHFKVINAPYFQFDFEADQRQSLLKAFQIKKKYLLKKSQSGK